MNLKHALQGYGDDLNFVFCVSVPVALCFRCRLAPLGCNGLTIRSAVLRAAEDYRREIVFASTGSRERDLASAILNKSSPAMKM